jgi:hypothetical protein
LPLLLLSAGLSATGDAAASVPPSMAVGVSVYPVSQRSRDVPGRPGRDQIVVEHPYVRVEDEVVPVRGPEPDAGSREHRSGRVEQPAAVVGVQVGADDVVDVGGRDSNGAQRDPVPGPDRLTSCRQTA